MDHPPERPHRLVVGVDFSGASIAAAVWNARWLVSEPEIVLVHVLAGGHGSRDAPTSGTVHHAEWSPERDAVERRLRGLGRELGAEFVWCEARTGDAADAILAVAAEFRADVIVTGARAGIESGRSAGDAAITRLVGHARLPVIVGAGPLERQPRRILVIGNGVSAASNAMRWARAVGGLLHADVRTLDASAERHREAPVMAGAPATVRWSGSSDPWLPAVEPDDALLDGLADRARAGRSADLVVIDDSALEADDHSGESSTAGWYAAAWATVCPVVFVPGQDGRSRG